MDFWEKRLAANAALVPFVASGGSPPALLPSPPRFPPDGTDPDLPPSRVQGAKPSKWMIGVWTSWDATRPSGIPIMVTKRVPSTSVPFSVDLLLCGQLIQTALSGPAPDLGGTFYIMLYPPSSHLSLFPHRGSSLPQVVCSVARCGQGRTVQRVT